LELLFAGIPYDVLEKRELGFACSCSRERIERVLISMGRQELAELREEQHQAEVTCEFCGEHYLYSADDLIRLIAGMAEGEAQA
jgi:molecular chaperone Hsp33